MTIKEENYIFWKDIWDRKGREDTDNLLYLDGYEHLNIEFDSKEICKKISNIISLEDSDYVLEVGCGAGFLSRDFGGIYEGIDYSQSLIEKNRQYHKKNVFVCEANKIFYPDKSFDKVFCFGLFQYFPTKKYAFNALEEMKRVARKCVFLGDLKTFGLDKHQKYCKDDFPGATFSECLHDPNDKRRFNVLIEVK